jgi:hypothetical protein
VKIYKVERTDNWSYDDYDSFVCFANSEDEARKLHPYGDDSYVLYEDGWHMKYSDGRIDDKIHDFMSWTHDISSLKVQELKDSDKPEVILASYNAG